MPISHTCFSVSTDRRNPGKNLYVVHEGSEEDAEVPTGPGPGKNVSSSAETGSSSIFTHSWEILCGMVGIYLPRVELYLYPFLIPPHKAPRKICTNPLTTINQEELLVENMCVLEHTQLLFYEYSSNNEHYRVIMKDHGF